MTENQIIEKATDLYNRMQKSEKAGFSYFNPKSNYNKLAKELRNLKRQYLRLTNEFLIIN